jgi:hypothetical protein
MTETVRTLSPAERRMLTCAMAHQQRRLGKMAVRIPLAMLIAVAPLCATTLLLQNGIPWPAVIAIWLGIGAFIGLWIYLGESSSLRRQAATYAFALQRNEVFETTIRSTSMVEFEELGSEGACYAFQVSDYRIMFVQGQDFYPTARFPNDDFSVACARDASGNTLASWIVKRGRKLAPVRVIPGDAKRSITAPPHLKTIAGRLGDLEKILSGPLE